MAIQWSRHGNPICNGQQHFVVAFAVWWFFVQKCSVPFFYCEFINMWHGILMLLLEESFCKWWYIWTRLLLWRVAGTYSASEGGRWGYSLHSKTGEANSLTVTLELGSSKQPAGASKCTVSWCIAPGCCSVSGWTSKRRVIWEYCRNDCLPNISLSPLEEESVERPLVDPFMELKHAETVAISLAKKRAGIT